MIWKERQDPKGSRHVHTQVITPTSPPGILTFKSLAAHVPQHGRGWHISVTSFLLSRGFQPRLPHLVSLTFARSPTLLSLCQVPLPQWSASEWHDTAPWGVCPLSKLGSDSREACMASQVIKTTLPKEVGVRDTLLQSLLGQRFCCLIELAVLVYPLGPQSTRGMNLACHPVLLEAAVTVSTVSLGEVTAESNCPCVHACDRVRGSARACLSWIPVIYYVRLTTLV